jgi:cytochrome c-type biogenesis protein CcmH
MIAFWMISTLFVAGALLFVVPPLLASRGGVRFSRSATNLAVYRDQSRELDADLAAGGLDAEQHAKARRELQARLLEDVADGDAASTPPRRGRGAAIAAVFAIPLCALALYFIVGNPLAIMYRQGEGDAAHDVSAQQVEALVERLATRMRESPDDPEGWKLLARSYGALGRFNQAAQAYANAAARLPGDAGLLADYADTLAMAQGRRLLGEPETIIARALAADPGNLKAHSLASSAAFEKKDYAEAILHLEGVLPLVRSDPDSTREIQARIAELRSLAGAARGGRATQAR